MASTADVQRVCRLHYIPLSQSYAEIYNIHAFFSGATDSALQAANATVLYMPPEKRKTIDGDRRLRRIARAGKQWKRTMGRRVDMEGVSLGLPLLYIGVSHPLLECNAAAPPLRSALSISDRWSTPLTPPLRTTQHMCTACAWSTRDCGRTTGTG